MSKMHKGKRGPLPALESQKALRSATPASPISSLLRDVFLVIGFIIFVTLCARTGISQHVPFQPEIAFVDAFGVLLTVSMQQIKPGYRETIDTVLLAVAGRSWELERAIAPPTPPVGYPSWHPEALYGSPLGQSLLLLADYAGGAFHPVSHVERAMKRVSRMVFGESLTNGYTLPARFHTTALGRLFHEVYARRYQPEELMSPAEVYRSLGIARQSLYDRIAEGTLTTVYLSGELRLVRAEIDAWRAQRAQRRQTKKKAPHE